MYNNKITNLDKAISAYINTMSGEYADDLLVYEERWEVYWALASVRRYTLSFYPIEEDIPVLVVGDRYGTLTGILCEKCGRVASVVDDSFYRQAILKRYRYRENLTVWQYGDIALEQKTKYSLAVINMEYVDEYDKILGMAIEAIDIKGHLLISIYSDRYDDVIKLLEQTGFTYRYVYNPTWNGSLIIEAARDEFVACTNDSNVYDRAPLLNEAWIKKHEPIFYGDNTPACDYRLIRKVKDVEFDLLNKLLDVCNRHGIKVYAIYGTLLGMMRDGGMIENDDDMDVALMREDYDRLIALGDEFEGKYFLQTPYNDEAFFGGYAKLRNRETTAIHPQNWWGECCEGISIDIFPIDRRLTGPEKENVKLRRIKFYQRMLYAKAYGHVARFKDMPLLVWKAYKYYGKFFTRKQLADRLHDIMCMGDKNGGLAIYSHYRDGNMDFARYMSADDFMDSFEFRFEDWVLNVPCGWGNLLKDFYGDGYMTRLEDNEYRIRHGFYDVDTPYTVYRSRFGGLKHPGSIGEPLLLVGDAKIIEECVRIYKDRLSIERVVTLPGGDMHKPIMGIRPERWQEFLEKPDDNGRYRIVVCAGDVRLAESMLNTNGYNEYCIFWMNRDWMLYSSQYRIWRELR